MNTITIKLTDENKNEPVQCTGQVPSPLVISDEFIGSICAGTGVKNLKELSLSLIVHDIALVIKDYSMTKKIYITVVV